MRKEVDRTPATSITQTEIYSEQIEFVKSYSSDAYSNSEEVDLSTTFYEEIEVDAAMASFCLTILAESSRGNVDIGMINI